MNYSALIQNRKSARKFSEKYVSFDQLDKLKAYHAKSVRRLIPELKTELRLFDLEARSVLEGAAGYRQFLVGSPQYMVLLSEKSPLAALNAGYVMEDLLLKLTDMDLDSCWLTFTDSEYVKSALGIDSDLEVTAIAAFGYGVKTTRRLRVNVRSMSNVDIDAQRRYFQPKLGINDMVFMDRWGNREGVDAFIGFYDDMLWEAFYAVSLAPSYLNRQAYGFVIRDGRITLVEKPDSYTGEIDGQLSLGVALLHFSAVISQWTKVSWQFDGAAASLELPEGYRAIASCSV